MIEEPTRRTILKGALAGLAGLVMPWTRAKAALPKSGGIVSISAWEPPTKDVPKPSGLLEIFTGPPPPRPGDPPTGNKLFSVELWEPTAWVTEKQGSWTVSRPILPKLSGTAQASGTPSHARITSYRGDGQVEVQDLTAGVGEGDINFNSFICAGATIRIGGIDDRPIQQVSTPDIDDQDIDWDDDWVSSYDDD
jgi:hypothetical protein